MGKKNKTSVKRLTGAMVGIPPRQVSFPMRSDANRYVIDDNATATTFLAMLSAIFPPGEMFFVESVRRFRHRINDPNLSAAISGFIGQEALHSREHEQLNAYFTERGFNTHVPKRAIEAGLWCLRKLSPKQQLACTTLMEHFTALFAEEFLTDEAFTQKFDPQYLPLWQWHALEELEHKAVAYNVQHSIGIDRQCRIRANYLVLAVIVPPALFGWFYLLAKEKKLTDIRDLKSGLALLVGKGGFMRRILPKMAIYSARSFHPDKHDTKALENLWRENLFGTKGRLIDQWKNQANLIA